MKQRRQTKSTAVLDAPDAASDAFRLPTDPLDPFEPPDPPVISLNILSPGLNADIIVAGASTTIPVSGTVKIDFGVGTITGVKVQVGASGTFQVATRSGESWSYGGGTVATSGPLRISAQATASYKVGTLTRTVTETVFTDLRVRLDTAPPSLAITKLPAGKQVTGSNQLFRVAIEGTASDDTEVTLVEVNVDNGGFTRVGVVDRAIAPQPAWSTWSAEFDVPLGPHQIVVRAKDRFNREVTRSETITAIDSMKPTVTIAWPQPGEPIPGTASGATFTMQGSAQDTQSGVARVEWQLGTTVTQARAAPTWSTWVAGPITVPAFPPQTITVRAFDATGNFDQTQLTVAVDVPPPLGWNPSDPVSYYSELLNFAKNRVRDATGQPVNFAAVFFQPFDQLATDSPASHLRLAIEVLRKYLAASAPVPAEATYRQAAYETMLSQIGTSYQEIRLAKNADPATRQALAARLGIDLTAGSTNELDTRLNLPPEGVTEAALEKLFGLRDTQRDPLTPTPPADLLTWQRGRLRRLWKELDRPANAAASLAPIVDPDLITENDLALPVAQNPASTLLRNRRAWVDGRITALANDRIANEQPLARFDRLVSASMAPTTMAMLIALDTDRKAGKNIDAQLAPTLLSREAFDHLMKMRAIATTGTVLPAEWADVYAILVQVQKLRNFPQWRAEESNLALGPDFFRIAVADGEEPPLRPWLATAPARRSWRDTLRARIDQDAAIASTLAAAVTATETATLPILRDALVNVAGRGLTDIDVANWLTDRLVVDVKDGGILQTTRIAQASQTIQGILFSLRAGRFTTLDTGLGTHPASTWSLNETPATFDRQWAWMGSFDGWRAASLVFLFPENLLLPGLRQDAEAPLALQATPAFQEFIKDVRSRYRISPQEARDAAKSYIKKAVTDTSKPAELTDAFVITDQLDPPGRTTWANTGETWLRKYPRETAPAARRFVEELFFFVPLQLALQLQLAGQHAAALDWFRIIYAYDLPYPQRKVYFGLKAEETLSSEIRRTEQWLLNSLNPHVIAAGRRNAYTRFILLSLVRCFLDYADAEFASDSDEAIARARGLYIDALDLLGSPELRPASPTVTFPPPNPVLQALRQHAELNLFKIRDARNIAGMRRQVVSVTPSAPVAGPAPTSAGQLPAPPSTRQRPTPYRYATLIERAKQLVSLAQQIEASYLAALEKRDAEAYNLLQAQHDLDLNRATVDLQKLRYGEATRGLTLAAMQWQRAQIQATHYQHLLSEGVSALELASLEQSRTAAGLQVASAVASVVAAYLPASIGVSIPSGVSVSVSPQGSMQALAGAMSSSAAALSTTASITGTMASYERRHQDWQFQRSLAQQDILVGEQQVQAAADHRLVVGQEGAVAQIQANHADATVAFLANKFTSAELYAWMSAVLGRVYGFFLQQATAIARLAESQLAFERQEMPPSFIQADYWQVPADSGGGTNGTAPDRRGLTGSARLLQSIYELDGFAFETNKRKLQLTKTISLARLAPFEFQRFKQTGVLPFQTPMELFDWDFPGHYLRLIKRVRVSMVALVPAVQGIRATLLCSGVSRVTIGGDTFQTVIVRRDPEQIALSSPTNTTGLFEFETQPELLFPFETNGVATSWEFQLPKAANQFNYDTIADVLLTLEYTALPSFDYRQQVIRQLDRSLSADRVFSLRDEFPDAFFELLNPDQQSPGVPPAIKLQTTRAEFPPNLEGLTTQQIVLVFERAPGSIFEIDVTPRFTFRDDTGAAGTVDGAAARAIGGVVSTRTSAAGKWGALLGKTPVGFWEFTLPNDQQTKNRLENGEIENVLLAVTYAGRTPEWPA